ncbi:MAG: sugar phosphate isomerase/epimerase [Acidobacteriota bacterium]|nr:sugar phosphate isomerase/epimerase [Acidobacteriota bacterium]
MRLKIACADFSFPLLPHDSVLNLIASLGIPGVDIGVFGGRSHLRPGDILKDISASARELSTRVSDRGLELSDIFLIPEPDFKVLAANHPDESERKRSREIFQRTLEFTARCNAMHMTGLPGVKWETENSGDSMSRAADELAWRVEQARQVGIVFSIEPHLGSVVPTPAETIHLLQITPGLTLTLDYGHFAYQGIPDDEVEPLIKFSTHFQARCAARSRVQSSMKENAIDFPRVVRAMQRDGYMGYLALEYVWIDWERCNEVDNLSESILLRDLLLGAQQ